jgi:hypothetical protein
MDGFGLKPAQASLLVTPIHCVKSKKGYLPRLFNSANSSISIDIVSASKKTKGPLNLRFGGMTHRVDEAVLDRGVENGACPIASLPKPICPARLWATAVLPMSRTDI